ncbi:MAG: O-methyltransferase [Ginsengibacter sp.]
MPEILSQIVNDYAVRFSSPTDALLKEIEQFTNENHHDPGMLSGPLQGKFLEIFSRIIQPEAILEIGTFTGYSALCLAKGLKENGELHTIELREKEALIANNFFAKSLQHAQIILHLGNALEIIPTIMKEWDLVFIDADKSGYIDYYELTLPRLKKNGIILVDNVLFHGQVLEENLKGKNAKAINSFNEYVSKDERVMQVMLTVRDGLMLITKK